MADFKSKMHQIRFLAGFKGHTSKVRGRRMREGRGKGGDRKREGSGEERGRKQEGRGICFLLNFSLATPLVLERVSLHSNRQMCVAQ